MFFTTERVRNRHPKGLWSPKSRDLLSLGLLASFEQGVWTGRMFGRLVVGVNALDEGLGNVRVMCRRGVLPFDVRRSLFLENIQRYYKTSVFQVT